MPKNVRPKKHLGQHFLNDAETAARIAGSLKAEAGGMVVEVGPGMGVLTRHLLERFGENLVVVEIDQESVAYLNREFPSLRSRIIQGDFLKLDFSRLTSGPVSVIGNFPYNISSQILFHVLDHTGQVAEVTGMFQKEVARRLTSGPGNRDYGILSVLMGTWYDSEYLFSVPPGVFIPPPKVDSGVIRFLKKENPILPCQPATLRRVVKLAFNQRRKTLRNALSSIWGPDFENTGYGGLRAEQLSVDDFLKLSGITEQARTER